MDSGFFAQCYFHSVCVCVMFQFSYSESEPYVDVPFDVSWDTGKYLDNPSNIHGEMDMKIVVACYECFDKSCMK